MKQSYPLFRPCLTMFLSMLLLSLTSFSQVFYVKTTGSDANDGASWATAFRSIQKALVVAPYGSKVLVAAGTYFPDEGFGATDNVRTSSFTLKNGVELYGGFEPDFGIDDLGDSRIKRSRLSGDLVQNDLLGSNSSDNAFHVVYSAGVGQNTVLDGFLIEAGNANGSIIYSYGGGMYNEGSSPRLTNCVFSGNTAGYYGGGIYNSYSSPTLTNCSFSGNMAARYGGGISNISYSSPTLTNCSFSGNTANSGGGIFNAAGSSPTLTNCIFSSNSAANSGGGMYNYSSSSPILTNCSISGNTAESIGGGMYNLGSSPTLANCILWGNTAPIGPEIVNTSSSTPSVTYSIVKYGYTGTGNLNQDPLFVDAANGDLHLQACSPAIDAGSNAAVPASISTDLDGNNRFIHTTIDMGVFEYSGALYTYYTDADVDGYGDASNSKETYCSTPSDGWVTNNSDCNDQDAEATLPILWYLDADGDNYAASTTTSCTNPGDGYTSNVLPLGDCNDADAALNPATVWYEDRDDDLYPSGATKTGCVRPKFYYGGIFDLNDFTYGKLASALTSLVNDCNDADAGLNPGITWFKDTDNDGFSDGTSGQGCYRPSGYKKISELIAAGGDCNDADAAINPNTKWYPDRDNDGYSTGAYIIQCVRPEGHKLARELTTLIGDCNDNDGSIHPNTTWLKDADNDGYTDNTSKRQCIRPVGYKLPSELISSAPDCNDADAAINPATIWYKDTDNDGYSDGTTKTQCIQPAGYKLPTALTATGGDCNDNNASVNPGAAEVCGNRIDDNCNGQVDETPCYACQNATGLSTTNIAASSARLTWSTTPVNLNPQDWELRYKTTNKGNKWITVGKIAGNKREYDAGNLLPDQYYIWQIRAKCGKNYTDFSIAIEFKTEGSSIAARSATVASPQTNSTDLPEGLTLYPNPASDHVTIQMRLPATENGAAVIQLLDFNGKLVTTQSVVIVNGIFQKQMRLPSFLSNGLYLVRIIANGKQYHKKMMIEK